MDWMERDTVVLLEKISDAVADYNRMRGSSHQARVTSDCRA